MLRATEQRFSKGQLLSNIALQHNRMLKALHRYRKNHHVTIMTKKNGMGQADAHQAWRAVTKLADPIVSKSNATGILFSDITSYEDCTFRKYSTVLTFWGQIPKSILNIPSRRIVYNNWHNLRQNKTFYIYAYLYDAVYWHSFLHHYLK